MDLSKQEIFRTAMPGLLNICTSVTFQKKPIIILKIDFEKVFDKVEYSAILAMLQAKGFGPKWISLVKSILYSASTYVLLNGVPGKKIICKRGVRQETLSHPYCL
jgi:hypothetical protein